MTARTLMVQGTASNVGKSFVVTALCRLFRQDGWRVAPFKSQNMSNNSYVTAAGLEIGRAQGVQAEAAGVDATADMNPVLLKPSGDGESQVVIHGRPHATMDFRRYRQQGYATAAAAIRSSLDRLRAAHDVVVLEGAGSPAEVNLRDRELVNMRVAAWADAPVLLVADIDRGGALAALVGTLALLAPDERERVAGLVINRFRGDRALLQPAIEFLEQHTGKPVLGVLPYLDLHLDAEDSLVLAEVVRGGAEAIRDRADAGRGGANAVWGGADPAPGLCIGAVRLPRVSNFTDLDALQQAPGVQVRWVEAPHQLAGIDAVVIPGSKNTAADLHWLWRSGLGPAIQRLAAAGTPVVGICGGFQMLGNAVYDPAGHESPHLEIPGLGLLDVATEFAGAGEKVTARSRAVVAYGAGPFAGLERAEVQGYEIHMGRTRLGPGAHPLLTAAPGVGAGADHGADHRNDHGNDHGADDLGGPAVLGAATAAGQVWGTYLHGIFHNATLRRAWLDWLWQRRGQSAPRPDAAPEPDPQRAREQAYDQLAAALRTHLDIEGIYRIIGLTRP